MTDRFTGTPTSVVTDRFTGLPTTPLTNRFTGVPAEAVTDRFSLPAAADEGHFSPYYFSAEFFASEYFQVEAVETGISTTSTDRFSGVPTSTVTERY